MNIFVLDENPKEAAKAHCDKHVIKMTLEAAQILSTVHRNLGIAAPYRATHRNHPVVKWAGESRENYLWTAEYGFALAQEYSLRYKAGRSQHKSYYAMLSLSLSNAPHLIPSRGLTPHVQCFDSFYQQEDPVSAYRLYYLMRKSYFAKWERGVQPPVWWDPVKAAQFKHVTPEYMRDINNRLNQKFGS